MNIISGSRDSWYLYAILPIYFFGPIISKIPEKKKTFLLGLTGLILVSLFIIGNGVGDVTDKIFKPLNLTTSFTWLFLLGVSFLSYYLVQKRKKIIKYLYLMVIITILFYISIPFIDDYYYVNICNALLMHQSPTNIILSMSIVVIASGYKYHSKFFNFIVKYLYFVYEFHWLSQLLWVYLFQHFAVLHPHGAFYISFAFVLSTSVIASITISIVQFKIWNPLANVLILKSRSKWESIVLMHT